MRKYIPVFAADYGDWERTTVLQHIARNDFLTSGKKVEEFEREFAKHVGRLSATMTNSGSSALFAAIYAMGWEPGDKIISPAVTFPTAISPLLWLGLVPVLVDVDHTLNIDPQKMTDAMTEVGGVKGAVIPHTLGNPCDPEVWDYFHRAVEDCCDALGSEINERSCGTFGTVSCFSFYPAHHITTGEGGMAVSMSTAVGDTIRRFVNWGRDCWCKPGFDNSCGHRFDSKVDGIDWDHKYEFVLPGGNFKPSFDAQGALGLVQLRKEEIYRAKRKRNWKIINDTLRPLEDLVGTAGELPGSDPSWFGYALEIRRGDRKGIIADLESAGVASRLVFGGNLARQRFARGKFLAPLPLERSDDIMRKWLVVACNHTVTEEEAHYIADTVKWAVTK